MLYEWTFEDFMLNEMSEKDKYSVIPLTRGINSRQTPRGCK